MSRENLKTSVHKLSHFGLTVSDLAQQINFFTNFLGFELRDRFTPFDESAVSKIIGVPDAIVREIAILVKGEVSIELLEYENSSSDNIKQKPCDLGFFHVLIECDCFDTTVTAAEEFGFRLHTPAYSIQRGPNAGKRGTYLRHNDGYALEVIGT